jgi:hypothetical protein
MMMVKAGFLYKGKVLAEYPIQVDGLADLGNGAKVAFEKFREQFPNLSLLEEGVVVYFSKAD